MNPSFIYGTAWKEERTEALTRQALEAGFVAVDTANQRKHYFEAGVGAAIGRWIGEGHARREDLWLQTKFTYARGQDHRLPYDPKARPAEQVTQSFSSSLEHLGTEYLDSYVLHGPSTGGPLTAVDWEVWRAMTGLRDAGKTRAIGISNVSAEQLDELCRRGPKPAWVQNRCYASDGWDDSVRTICRNFGVTYQGFSLLTANRRELASPLFAQLSERIGRTIPQIVFRFSQQIGIVPLTGSSNPAHLREDLTSADFTLSEGEIAAIAHCG
jgi:diketogulonate reductase-like aldo/keto reductase